MSKPVRNLILGGTGLLGQQVVQKSISLGHETVATYFREKSKNYLGDFGIKGYQISDDRAHELESLVNVLEPSNIINCISLSSINCRSENELKSVYVNIPKILGGISEKFGINVINISTDAVFSGSTAINSEDSITLPQTRYGIYKLQGEVESRYVKNIRCSMFGIDEFEERGLFNWFLSTISPKIFFGYRFSGVSTQTLANSIFIVLEKPEDYPNVINVAGESIDKGDLLLKLNRISKINKPVKIEQQNEKNFSLDGSLFAKISGVRIPSVDQQIDELIKKSSKVTKYL